MRRGVQALIGLVIGAIMVWLLFRDTDWHEVGQGFKRINYGWFFAAQIPLWLTFPVRVQRWTYIVRVDRPVSYRHLFSATQIGFLGNFVLPARAGEGIRALVLTRLTGIPFFKSFAMVGLDRITDLFGLIAVVLVAILAYQPAQDVSIPAATFSTAQPIVFDVAYYRIGAALAAISLVVIIAGFVLVYLNRRLVLRISDAVAGFFSKWLAEKLHTAIDHFADGMHVFKSPADMAKSIAFSLATWSLAVMFLYMISRAFFPNIPWYLPFVMQALIAAGISIPGPPGFIGQFHIPVVIAFVMLVPDINVSHAKGAAIVMHLMNLPPVALFGVWSLMRENVGLFELRKQAAQAEQAVEAQPPA